MRLFFSIFLLVSAFAQIPRGSTVSTTKDILELCRKLADEPKLSCYRQETSNLSRKTPEKLGQKLNTLKVLLQNIDYTCPRADNISDGLKGAERLAAQAEVRKKKISCFENGLSYTGQNQSTAKSAEETRGRVAGLAISMCGTMTPTLSRANCFSEAASQDLTGAKTSCDDGALIGADAMADRVSCYEKAFMFLKATGYDEPAYSERLALATCPSFRGIKARADCMKRVSRFTQIRSADVACGPIASSEEQYLCYERVFKDSVSEKMSRSKSSPEGTN